MKFVILIIAMYVNYLLSNVHISKNLFMFFAIKPDTARHIEKSIVFPLATTEQWSLTPAFQSLLRYVISKTPSKTQGKEDSKSGMACISLNP